MDDTSGDSLTPAKQPGLLRRLWDRSGLLPVHVILAFKGALPATIALAAYESHTYAGVYSTLGYLVAIMAHLSLAIQPRAKFIQSMTISVIATCVGAAVALLQIQCVVAARATPAGGITSGQSGSQQALSYDASSCVVSAVFLFTTVFVVNSVLAARPQLKLPMIQFSIFSIVSSVYAPSFGTMAAGISFVRRLLIAFLTGFGIGTGVCLFVVPMTSRSSVEKQMGGLLGLYKACIATHSAYMGSVTTFNPGVANEEEKKQAAKMQALIVQVGGLVSKIKLELGFARKEVAYGKLGPSNYSEISEHLRAILQPVMGLATFLEMMRALREHGTTSVALPESPTVLEAMKKLEMEEWDEVISQSKVAYEAFKTNLLLGLDHIAYKLEFTKPPKRARRVDVEEAEGIPQPGQDGFAEHLEAQLKKYHNQRNEVIQHWAEDKGFNLPKRFWPVHATESPLQREESAITRKKLNQNQLYLILYIKFLAYNIGESVLKLVKYADARVEDGTMKKKRIINPGWRRIRKLILDAFQPSNNDESLSSVVNGGSNIQLGDSLQHVKDPEHLPPTNLYQKITDMLRTIPRLLSSEPAAFGFRTAIATMSIGLPAFLRQSRNFVLEQRGMWSIIMTAISMSSHAGQGLFGFAARTFGTAFAMVASIIIWYMCDHKHAAILVIFYIYLACWVLFLVRNPQYAVIAMVSSITVVLIIGYELQVDVIGIKLAVSNGQEYYPVYLLGPYRLAAVTIGLAVGFFWTYFPYPITTHGVLRRHVGATLYILANYHSCVHTTLETRLQLGPAYKDQPANSPIKKLDAARSKVFSKTLLMITKLREYHDFTRFEPPFGGRFPREKYEELTTSIRNVFTYFALLEYSSQAFIREPEGQTQAELDEETQWLKNFREFAVNNTVTSHQVTSSLCLLSASMRNAQPLPPYIQPSRRIKTADATDELDPVLFGIEHLAHPCYAAFAVGEVTSAFVAGEMAKITRQVKDLVGEVDFSFHVISTRDDGESMTSTLWDKEVKNLNGNGSTSSAEKTKGD